MNDFMGNFASGWADAYEEAKESFESVGVFKPIPSGYYESIAESFDIKESKSGSTYLRLKFKLIDDKANISSSGDNYKGRTVQGRVMVGAHAVTQKILCSTMLCANLDPDKNTWGNPSSQKEFLGALGVSMLGKHYKLKVDYNRETEWSDVKNIYKSDYFSANKRGSIADGLNQFRNTSAPIDPKKYVEKLENTSLEDDPFADDTEDSGLI
jgi:hypothetical protein